MAVIRWLVFAAMLGLWLAVSAPEVGAEAHQKLGTTLSDDDVARVTEDLFSGEADIRRRIIKALVERGNADAAPALIDVLRFLPNDDYVTYALAKLTGAVVPPNWHDWQLWLEEHDEIRPFDGYDGFKADLMATLDENFRLFLRKGIKHTIRLEEIVWGGVRKDGIPALIDPRLIAPDAAAYLTPDELVFGVRINGDARAYPLRILDWHEMFNDVIGGVPVALAYCTLCGSGILYETKLENREEALIFGSSGFLYRSNKLMYDRGTNSLWNQFTGVPVVGELVGAKINLKARPVVITTWKKWLGRNPDTKVLSLNTGYRRDYTPGNPYGRYFASPKLMFPARVTSDRLAPKDYVFALRMGAAEKAWPLKSFAENPVINDNIGAIDVVLIGNPRTRTVRAYAAGGGRFAAAGLAPDGDVTALTRGAETWKIEEDWLVGPKGTRLERLPGHIAYWFAWNNFKRDAPVAPNYTNLRNE